MATLAPIVTMPFRILSLLLCLLMAGLLSWTAFALARPLTHFTTAASPCRSSPWANGVPTVRALHGYDRQGDMRLLVKDEGEIVSRYTHDSFGMEIEQSGHRPYKHWC